MTRALTFREVITVLLRQGSKILCFRCHEPILYAEDAEREHYLEKALGGDDSALNARISHCGCHAQVTRGTGATTAGSSVGKAAKDKRIAKGKMEVQKPDLDPTPAYCLGCETPIDSRIPHHCPAAAQKADERARRLHSMRGAPMPGSRASGWKKPFSGGPAVRR
jgi:hypothetical protein